VTTATHSLDTSSGSTTVAELLARHGGVEGSARRRRGAEPADEGQFGGTLTAFPPVEEPTEIIKPVRYRYDQNTVTALLAAQPEAEEPAAPTVAVSGAKHTGRKIAGLAFAGAVLVGGWALASAQAQPADSPVNADPAPVKSPETPSAVTGLTTPWVASAAAPAVAPPATAEIPAAAQTTAQQPDEGSFSGSLPTKQAPAAKKSTSKPAPTTQAAQPSPNWQAYYDAFQKAAEANKDRGGDRDGGGRDGGGKHRGR